MKPEEPKVEVVVALHHDPDMLSSTLHNNFTPEYALRFAVLTRGRGLGFCLDMTNKKNIWIERLQVNNIFVGKLSTKIPMEPEEADDLLCRLWEHELGPTPPGAEEVVPTDRPSNCCARCDRIWCAKWYGEREATRIYGPAADYENWGPCYECCWFCDRANYKEEHGEEAAVAEFGTDRPEDDVGECYDDTIDPYEVRYDLAKVERKLAWMRHVTGGDKAFNDRREQLEYQLRSLAEELKQVEAWMEAGRPNPLKTMCKWESWQGGFWLDFSPEKGTWHDYDPETGKWTSGPYKEEDDSADGCCCQHCETGWEARQIMMQEKAEAAGGAAGGS
jgi:hypothetical protein